MYLSRRHLILRCPSSVVRPSSVPFSTFRLLNIIQRNLTWSKISTSSTKFVFFTPINKSRWPPQPLIGWDIFDFSSETAERNSTKRQRKQDSNVLYPTPYYRLQGRQCMCNYQDSRAYRGRWVGSSEYCLYGLQYISCANFMIRSFLI